MRKTKNPNGELPNVVLSGEDRRHAFQVWRDYIVMSMSSGVQTSLHVTLTCDGEPCDNLRELEVEGELHYICQCDLPCRTDPTPRELQAMIDEEKGL